MRAPLRFFRPGVDLGNERAPGGILAVPLLLGSVLAFFRPLWDNWLASGLAAGAPSRHPLRARCVDTPAQIFPGASPGALPFMSERLRATSATDDGDGGRCASSPSSSSP